jgi:hypothetical protein
MAKLMLTKFEIDVMNKLLDGDHPVLALLRDQFVNSRFLRREVTDAGFFLTFNVKIGVGNIHGMISNVRARFCFGDVQARISGLDNGAGFLLWVADGYITQLEGYTFGEKWPSQVNKYELYYIGGKRNVDILSQEWLIESQDQN